MGNNTPSEQSSLISQQDFRTRSGSLWIQRDNCLFYSSWQRPCEKYCVSEQQLDLSHPAVCRYFERLRMMESYLQGGNLHLPLMCVAEGIEECACKTQGAVAVKFYFQPFEIKLVDEIRARKQHRETFREAELWFILYNLLNAVRRFQPFCEKSGRVSTQDVLLNGRGEIRLRCILSGPFAGEDRGPSLQSPEELQAMRLYFGREILFNRYLYKQINVNPNICQTYSLAVLLLGLADGTPPEGFYVGLQVDGRAIGEAVGRLAGKGYSRLLVNLLTAMLSEYRYRPLPSQVYEVFSQYEQQILRFLPFRLKPDLKASMINIL